MRKYPTFRTVGASGITCLEFRPAQWPQPKDDSMLMGVFRTDTMAGFSILLMRDQVAPLRDWLLHGFETYDVPGAYGSAEFNNAQGRGCWVTVKSYQRDKTMYLLASDRRAVAAWLQKIDRQGWEGWSTGLLGSPTAEVD